MGMQTAKRQRLGQEPQSVLVPIRASGHWKLYDDQDGRSWWGFGAFTERLMVVGLSRQRLATRIAF